MEGNMMTLAPLCLLLFWMMPVDSTAIRYNLSKRVNQIPLNMAEDSIDDMYSYCKGKMEKKVKDEYFKKENTGKFGQLWKKYDNHKNLKVKVKGEEALTEEHKKAILIYSDDLLYGDFNKAVLTGKNHYGTTSFMFHSLYFWLTSAIQILNNNAKCYYTYRRTRNVFEGIVGQKMRFGSFASSSFRNDLHNFGDETCFKIKTCHGAYLKYYSVFPDEEEVLIPPYEVFIIKQKIQGKYVKVLKDCKLVYVLASAGKRSNLNCKWFKKVKVYSHKHPHTHGGLQTFVK